MEQTNKQTEKTNEENILTRFETPGALIEAAERIAALVSSGNKLLPGDRLLASALIGEFVRERRAKMHGRPAKWSSMQEKNAYYNARRKKKN